MFVKKFQATLLALGLMAIMAPAAFASDGTTATVTGGSLTISNPLAADFAGRNVTGADQTTTAALDAFSVSDLTGTGDGWHVTAQATTFTGANHALAAGSLSMSQPTVASPNTASPDPTIAAGAYTIDNGAVEIASADVDEGMGIYNFSATTLTLSLPADVYADAYASTVTISVVTAP
jgi:hypothetical protein